MTAKTPAPRSAGPFLLYRKDGNGINRPDRPADRARAKAAGARTPWFRHPTYAAAEQEAKRLLVNLPDSTFVILQEVGRISTAPAGGVHQSPSLVAIAAARDRAMEKLRGVIRVEVQDNGVWSLRFVFGRGDDACRDMRAASADLRAALGALPNAGEAQ